MRIAGLSIQHFGISSLKLKILLEGRNTLIIQPIGSFVWGMQNLSYIIGEADCMGVCKISPI